MTEKDKMIAGEIYDANDSELVEERFVCKEICQAYNNVPVRELEKRRELLKQLLGKTCDEIVIEPPFWCDYGYGIEVGSNFYANHGLVILDAGGVKYGDNVFIGPQCGFHTSGHPIDWQTRNKGLEYARAITVGDNVWIGAGVQVMPGVTIGSNVVIGGGSVVVKDIPSNCVAAGNPCKVIRAIDG